MSTLEQKRGYRRRVVAGFPWEGRFATIEEAKVYVSGDRIQCLLCGKVYRALSAHINGIHEVSEAQYKYQFGIPYGIGLVSSETSVKQSDAVVGSARYGSLKERINKVRIDKLAAGGGKFRPVVSSVLNQRINRIREVNKAKMATTVTIRPHLPLPDLKSLTYIG